MQNRTLHFLYPLFLRPEKSTMADKKVSKNPHGTFCGMGTKVILFPDIPVIVKKISLKNVSLGCTWDPYLPARLNVYLHLKHITLFFSTHKAYEKLFAQLRPMNFLFQVCFFCSNT